MNKNELANGVDEGGFTPLKVAGDGCGKFILIIAGSLLLIGIFWGGNYLWGWERTQTPTFPPAKVTTQQVDDLLIVSWPNNGIKIEMVLVPAGEFPMGSIDEAPVHDVNLDTFWIDRTEVTNDQFAAFIKVTGYQTTAEQEGVSRVEGLGADWRVNEADWQHPQGPDSHVNGLGEHPVVQVSWHDATAYCLWRGARLPTEAEWEKAARGTDGRRYPWGNQFDGTRLNFCDANCFHRWQNIDFDDNYVRTAPVGSYPDGASPYSALDMVGNVAEWVSDWYIYDYYSQSPTNNPQGPADEDIPKPTLFNHMNGGAKGVRGGGWNSSEPALSVDYRNRNEPENSDDSIGFRCAYVPK
jgi:formylglycine-generating enzyme required for sulfatase activity